VLFLYFNGSILVPGLFSQRINKTS